jgi:hypothetical protein
MIDLTFDSTVAFVTTAASDLSFMDDTALEFVGGGTITNTL